MKQTLAKGGVDLCARRLAVGPKARKGYCDERGNPEETHIGYSQALYLKGKL